MPKARSNRLYKAAQKEIRSGQALFDPNSKPVLGPKTTPKQLLKTYPKKIAKSGASKLKADIKEIKIKKIKLTAKKSKRTTPGIPEATAAPHFVHVEGVRWGKTIQKQSRIQARTMSRQAQKGRKK
jgi:hypothetical protein